MEGAIELAGHHLTIGPNGKARSNIKAADVTIYGTVQGDVDAARKVAVKKDGQMIGNITTSGITIDDEAYFKGSIDILRKQASGS